MTAVCALVSPHPVWSKYATSDSNRCAQFDSYLSTTCKLDLSSKVPLVDGSDEGGSAAVCCCRCAESRLGAMLKVSLFTSVCVMPWVLSRRGATKLEHDEPATGGPLGVLQPVPWHVYIILLLEI